jgi:hypothetical protein
MKGLIYCAISPSYKKYYGQTISFTHRKITHKRSIKNGDKSRFYDAIRKYSFDEFTWTIIEEFDFFEKIDLKLKLDERETYWIEKDKTYLSEFGYNMTHGGAGRVGVKLSKEHIEILRKANTGEGNGNFGKIYTIEESEYLRNLYKGKTYEELYGLEKANIMKNKLIKNIEIKKELGTYIPPMTGKQQTKESNIKRRKKLKGRDPWNKGKYLNNITGKYEIVNVIKGNRRLSPNSVYMQDNSKETVTNKSKSLF